MAAIGGNVRKLGPIELVKVLDEAITGFNGAVSHWGSRQAALELSTGGASLGKAIPGLDDLLHQLAARGGDPAGSKVWADDFVRTLTEASTGATSAGRNLIGIVAHEPAPAKSTVEGWLKITKEAKLHVVASAYAGF